MSKKVRGKLTAEEAIHRYLSRGVQPTAGKRDWHKPTQEEIERMLQEDIEKQQRIAQRNKPIVNDISDCK